MSLKETDVIELYLGLFGEAPTKEVLESLLSAEDKVAALESLEIADVTEEQSNEDFINSIYENLFNYTSEEPTDANEAGIAYWVARLEEEGDGNSRAEILAEITESAKIHEPKEENEANLSFLNSSVEEIAADLGVELPEEPEEPETPDVPSVEGKTQYLDVGRDVLTGTKDDDLFIADVVQNNNGQQVNTLGSGDRLDGGAGNDTLEAQVTAGAFVNGLGNQSMPIQPKTSNIENIKLEAVNAGILGGRQNTEVYVNAKDMEDVSYIGSERSDANLTIQNLTSKGVGHVSNMTVGMKYTGNADSNWDKSDLTVLFDQDYLTRVSTSGENTLELRFADAYELAENKIPTASFDTIKVTLEGVGTLEVDITSAQKTEGFAAYDQIVGLLNAEFAKTKGWENVSAATNGIRNLLFNDDVDNKYSQGEHAGQYNPILLTNKGPEKFGVPSYDTNTTNPHGARFETSINGQAVDIIKPVSVDVELEKVGLAGQGGTLNIGSMNKGNGENSLNSGATTSNKITVQGVEQFNVKVNGDLDKTSHLTELRSTNNVLRTVIVETGTGGKDGDYAGLKINELKDVKTFDASGLKGDLTLTANLTKEVAEKYLNRTDTADNYQADNEGFIYNGGSGNDAIIINVDTNNLSTDRSLTNREDFSLHVDGGAGNDTITVNLDNSSNPNQTWLAHQFKLKNISIDGGAGNDTINVNGSGVARIDAGDGNDTVYVDNTGAKATWVVAADNLDLGNLKTADTTAAGFLYNGQLTITYAPNGNGSLTQGAANANNIGFEATAKIPTGGNFATNQYHYNQAIKKAINEDAVLSKLLVAKDGPGETLIIESLIDGSQVAGDLKINVKANVNGLSQTEEANLLDAFQKLTNNSSATLDQAKAAVGQTVTNANNVNGFNNVDNLAVSGNKSQNHNDSIIDAGRGNDVVVLATGDYSNNTVKFTGYDLGKTTVVNFNTTGSGADRLDFSSYLTSKESASGSAISQKVITAALNGDSTVEANSITVLSNFTEALVGTDRQTFAGLNESNLLAALNNTNDGSSNYGNFGVNTLTADKGLSANKLVNGEGKAVVLIENPNNKGEYKVFELVWNGSASNQTGNFDAINFITTLDLGNSLTNPADALINNQIVNSNEGPFVPPVVSNNITLAQLKDQNYDFDGGDFNLVLDWNQVANEGLFGLLEFEAKNFGQGDTITLNGFADANSMTFDGADANNFTAFIFDAAFSGIIIDMVNATVDAADIDSWLTIA